MEHYLTRHLKIASLKHSPFDDQAITAIHQGSGGLFRKANHLARGHCSPLPVKNPRS